MFLRANSRTHINFKKSHIDELELIFLMLWTEELLYLKNQNCFIKYMEFLMWVLRFERPLILKLFQYFELRWWLSSYNAFYAEMLGLFEYCCS